MVRKYACVRLCSIRLHELFLFQISTILISISNLCAKLKYSFAPSPIFYQHKLFYQQSGSNAAQIMKFSIKDLFSKFDQIRRKLRIWSHVLKKSLMEKFIFCAVQILN